MYQNGYGKVYQIFFWAHMLRSIGIFCPGLCRKGLLNTYNSLILLGKKLCIIDTTPAILGYTDANIFIMPKHIATMRR